jgi:hypothetical protein
VEANLGIGFRVFEALVPGFAGKHPQSMGSRLQILENEGSIGIVMGDVGTVVQHHVQMRAETQLRILEKWVPLHREANGYLPLWQHLTWLGAEDLNLRATILQMGIQLGNLRGNRHAL